MWEDISPYLSAVVLIGGAAAVIWKILKPVFALVKEFKAFRREYEMDKKETREKIEKLEDHDRNDQATFKGMEKALLSIVNHMIDGNGLEGLKAARNDLQELILK